MRTDRLRLAAAILAVAAVLTACADDTVVPEPSAPLFAVPTDFPAPLQAGIDDLTADRVDVGRRLFYDDRLSRNGTISCASCHQQAAAFAHAGHTVSHGIDDLLGIRNTPTMQNLAWRRDFFWDGGVLDLASLPIAPITNPVEMDHSIQGVVATIDADPALRARMTKAFGTEPVTGQHVLRALRAFMLTVVSANSRYDSVQHGTAHYTPVEAHGAAVFDQQCRSCHAGPLFSDESFRSNGLQPTSVDDRGRETITLDATHRYHFRVPSLRNVAVSGPWMHDGRYRTLRAAVAHYRNNVADLPTLDPLLRHDAERGLPLSDADVDALVAFLNTLTDHSLRSDRRFAAPL